ncbi:M18 family aminopeptidase [Enemella dayhoffiae]|uniref:M18 family aminopeptidase n=1 Tax=Enemella dayhoffiae TaxID=2016507 RepID=A0A255H030_9ACTN|nr:M18 family aminopeptidase [Enemella dayhoffiae]OYO21158.1 M18 family aminopeptidase [Enemella dayhoffiae]
MPHADSHKHVADLAAFVVASPSSYHAAAEVARVLSEAGFTEQVESEEWDASPGGHYLVRDGAVVAWRVPQGGGVRSGFRIVGTHTDSPTFKLKPDPTYGAAGWQQVGVEVYGSPLIASWTDRELGIAGRVVTRRGEQVLARTDAVMRIPQLAIHLNRSVNDEGLRLDKQVHTQPIFSVRRPDLQVLDLVTDFVEDGRFPDGLTGDQVAGHDLVAFDTAKPKLFGADDSFLACGRLDNLSSVHASMIALLNTDDSADDIAVLAAFDHEEVGSGTRSGACGPLLEDVLLRTATALGAGPEEYRQMLQRSSCISADAGHAVHPNYVGHHDPVHRPLLNEGPLLKINANQRYASDAVGEMLWRRACAVAGVPLQQFVSNNQLPCGSTIGPLTATRLGITTVDVGIPLLSMHSIREMAGVDDLYFLTRALQAFWAGA